MRAPKAIKEENMIEGCGVIILKRRIRGVSFCQVVRRRHKGQEIKDITDGNQKWKGGKPNLVRSPRRINITGRLEDPGRRGDIKVVIAPRRNSPDPRV